MKIEAACAADAPPISALIQALSGPFFSSPGREGAEPFLAAISDAAISRYILSSHFSYFIARSGHQLAGVVALRDNSHLFHLFVAPPFQGQGLARRLWQHVQELALAAGNPGQFTVNASRNAVPVYERFGFVCHGVAQHANGVTFQPMVLHQRPPDT